MTFCTFWPPWVRPWDNRGKCYIDGKRTQCWLNVAAYTHLSSTVYELYCYRDIGRKLQLFPTSLAFNAPVGGDPIGRSS